MSIRRYSQACLVVFLLTLPIVIYWAAQLRFGTAYVEAWLPATAPSRVAYREYRERFGSDQYLLISWDGCTVADPRLPELAERLREIARSRPELQIELVSDSFDSIEKLAAALLIDRESASQRLAGIAVGEQGAAMIALRLGLGAVAKHSQLVHLAEAEAQGVGVPKDDLILAGEAYQIHMIDRASRESMQYYVIPSSLLALTSAWLCIRSVRLTLVVFAFAGYGQALGMALVSFFFSEMSAVMVVLPTLVFMLTLSAAVHLANYYRDVVCDSEQGVGEMRAGERALQIGWRPCALATITTVIGFGSLYISHLSPVWQFGSLAAVGLSLSTLVLLSCFPMACQLLVGQSCMGKRHGAGPMAAAAASQGSLWIRILLGFTSRFPGSISAIGLLLLMLAVIGLLNLKTSTEFEDMFGSESRAVKNLRWVEQNLGPLNSLELQLEFATADDSRLIERLGTIESVVAGISENEQVETVYSALTFLPAIPLQSGMRGTIQRSILRRKLQANIQNLLDNQVLARDGDGEVWRLSVRIPQLRSDNYDALCKELLATCQERLAQSGLAEPANAESSNLGSRPQLSISGLRTVIETAHQSLLGDLSSSFAAAFALITPVMMLVTRGVLSGLLMMVPNLLPVAAVFGIMGWLGVRLDVASILTASVALGIAVDDTLHFLSWFIRARRSGLDDRAAVADALLACGRPMLHTTIICTTAMLPFLLSDFGPTAKFALLMILILSGAIAGDLILLPALLLSPLGKLIPLQRGGAL